MAFDNKGYGEMTDKESFHWNSIVEMLNALNHVDCEVLVLRNFELFENNRLLKAHEDIDLLCTDQNQVISLLHARQPYGPDDKTHISVCVSGENVPIDLRVIGDNYYDRKWEIEMMRRRIRTADGYYIMDPVNYIYSLIYHGFLHKGNIKREYVERILHLAGQIGMEIKEKDFRHKLREFMNAKGYMDTGYRSK